MNPLKKRRVVSITRISSWRGLLSCYTSLQVVHDNKHPFRNSAKQAQLISDSSRYRNLGNVQ